jgi:hypothetical protein
MNILSWLTAGRVTPDSAVIPMFALSGALFGIGVIVYVLKKTKA